MKKIIVMLLAAVLLLSLCACGADVPEGDANLQITAKPKTQETTGETTVPEETTGDVTVPGHHRGDHRARTGDHH